MEKLSREVLPKMKDETPSKDSSSGTRRRRRRRRRLWLYLLHKISYIFIFGIIIIRSDELCLEIERVSEVDLVGSE